MIQLLMRLSPVFGLILSAVVMAGCEGRTADRHDAAAPTVASLVPAATDLLIGMGAADHLVAVSNYDADRPETRHLPRVGDYQTTDWERLHELRPDVMVIQLAEDRVPAGMRQRAERLGIELVNVEINRLEDILTTMQVLGEAIEQPERSAAASDQLREQLDGVRERVAGREPVATLMVMDDAARHVVGPDNFLDDLLSLAGGRNVAGGFANPWPSIDREMIDSLAPEAIILLMPNASETLLSRAERFWAGMPDLPAVREGRIHVVSDWYVLQPGAHVGDLAGQLAAHLHPDKAE